jgi:hypothetical protein
MGGEGLGGVGGMGDRARGSSTGALCTRFTLVFLKDSKNYYIISNIFLDIFIFSI